MTIKFQLFLYLHHLGRRRRHIAAALGRNIQNIMNWIILIVAGLCEVGFTYCLGRAKSVEGPEWRIWIGGFLIFSVVSMTFGRESEQSEQYWSESSFSMNLSPSGECCSH